jgi:hypothetical protein
MREPRLAGPAALDATRWPNMRDCTNAGAGTRGPCLRFGIKDDQWQSRSMPLPYNDLVGPRDPMTVGARA